MNQYTTLRDVAVRTGLIPDRNRKPSKPPSTKPPVAERKGKCPSGFRWDSKKGKCVQAGVGPEYRP